MKILSAIFSTKTALVLLIILASAMAIATFVENDFGTPSARAWFYDAWWFEVLLIWLSLNFILHLFQYQSLSKFSWPIGLFHLAFILIIIGAGITRYISNEGMMHIREGDSSNVFYSQKKYLQIQAVNHDSQSLYQPVHLIANGFKPITKEIEYNNLSLNVNFLGFYPKAIFSPIKGDKTYLELSIAVGDEGREDFVIQKGESAKLGQLKLNTNPKFDGEILIFKDSIWKIRTKKHLQMMEMATQQMSVLHENEEQPLRIRTLYQFDGGAFVIKNIHENIKMKYESSSADNDDLPDIIHYNLTDNKGKIVAEHFVKMVSFQSEWKNFEHNGKAYTTTYGPKPIQLPFSLQLKKFELNRYPGSQSPSGYASHVVVKGVGESFPYKIFMNNVLDYEGYRFYQSSYDTDEKGTVLSINQDRIGTYVTYLAYTLLTIGMFLAFFIKNGRFSQLNKQLKSLKNGTLILLVSFFSFSLIAQESKEIVVVPDEISTNYGRLIVQDKDGRMKPLNTLANEIIRKIYGKSQVKLKGEKGDVHLTAEQFLLAIQLDPQGFTFLPLIKNDYKKVPELYKVTKAKPANHIAFSQLVDSSGKYLLSDLVEKANKLKPSERNESHNEILKIDERFNIFYGLLTGDFLRIFPNRLDKDNTWFTSQQTKQGFEDEDAYFVSSITPMFLTAIENGLKSNDFKEAKQTLDYLHLYQKKAGENVYPTENEINTELLYNKLNLGNRLFGWFWLIGLLMLFLCIVQLFKDRKWLDKLWLFGVILSWVGLSIFTFHLLLRWYIAKHPPWSDGFEMLVFVAWGVLIFGLLMSKKSKFTLPIGLIFSGILLFVSFLDWLNPEITNLMPVLESYWLKIHVAVIVSGYAPLALSALLGLISLILIIFSPKEPTEKWLSSIKELTIVNEMSIMIGLFLLTVGTFLGGVWANESWGRYWAWDPKETWALISIVIYVIVIHLRLVPKFKDGLIFNIASMWSFASIIMTSFGVNYYLSGLHSYAKGDPVPVPNWVYILALLLLIITVLAIFKHKKKEVN